MNVNGDRSVNKGDHRQQTTKHSTSRLPNRQRSYKLVQRNFPTPIMLHYATHLQLVNCIFGLKHDPLDGYVIQVIGGKTIVSENDENAERS